MLIGWTTVEKREQADSLAKGLIEERLAACVQIEGPITSHYWWDGHLHQSQEYRLTIKFLPGRQLEVEAWILNRHPYEIPEWIVVRADHVAEKYLSWAHANSTSTPL